MVCWLTAESELRAGAKLAIKHTTRWGRALVKDLQYRLDVNTPAPRRDRHPPGPQRDRPGPPADHRAAVLRRVPPQPDHRQLRPGRRDDQQHRRRRHHPRADRGRGARERARDLENVVWQPGAEGGGGTSGSVAGATVWFHRPVAGRGSRRWRSRSSGPSARRPAAAYLLDGDNVRHGLNADLGFRRGGPQREHPPHRRGGPACSPTPGWWRWSRSSALYRADRDRARRSIHEAAGLPFVEVFVDTPIDVCEARDQRGGPLRQGPGRGDQRVHRHRRPLRGARALPTCGSPRPTATRGTGLPGCWRCWRAECPYPVDPRLSTKDASTLGSGLTLVAEADVGPDQGLVLDPGGWSASAPSCLWRQASYSLKLPSNQRTSARPRTPGSWVAMRSRNQRSWLITTAQPG